MTYLTATIGSDAIDSIPVIEVEADGSDRRAHARAWVREVAPGTWVVIPFYVREVSGPSTKWFAPARGNPILTANPIESLSEANAVLATWLMRTFAENARQPRHAPVLR